MSYNGSGVFNINTAGQPVVTGTVISSTAFNALTADLATGLTTALTKDGQTTPTANIPMGGFKITGIAAATTTGDALSYGRAATVSTLTNSALTSGRVPYASTAGLLVDSASLTYDGTTLTATTGANFATSSGNVGIGTSSPAQKLQISANEPKLRITSTAGSGKSWDISSGGNTTVTLGQFCIYDTTTDSQRFNIASGSGTMLLDASGNLGLGVTPSAWNTGWNVFQIGSAGSIAAIKSTTGPSVTYSNNAYLTTGGAWNYITSSPTNAATQYEQYAGAHKWYNAASGTGAITWTQAMTLDASGNLFVQCTAQPSGSVPGFEIVKNGTTSSYFITGCTSTAANTVGDFYNPNGRVGGISISGSATTFSTSSDYRLKENVQPMSGALTTITQLNPVTFKWKADGSDSHGFIAHELQAIVPECVTGKKDETKEEQYEITPAIPAVLNEEGNVVTETIPAVMGTRIVPVYQGIDTSFLVATLTAAIQEQQAIIESLNARLTALESK